MRTTGVQRRTLRCSVRTCGRRSTEGATRLETPGPDGAPLSLLVDNGPDRTGVCARHAEGYAVAQDIWEKAGMPVMDRRRPRTPEEEEMVRRFLEEARNKRNDRSGRSGRSGSEEEDQGGEET